MKLFYTPVLVSLISLLMLTAGEANACTALGDQTTYGTNNVWIGYVYQGKTFGTYNGYVTEGIASSPNFDESFGGGATYNTNGCPITTTNFAVRYKLNQTFVNGTYT